MRKTLLSALFMVLMTVAAFAAREDLYVLHAGFEDGAIPEGWTQENVAGQTSWIVEKIDTALYPKGTADGDFRVMLRNTTDQTQRFCTRLITPAMDLREVTLPVLMFSHAQLQRTGDVDTLRVYYRSSEEARWVLLATYPDKTTSKYTKWTSETIDLPAQSGTYQLAFEGSDNFGRGIALDEIIVRPMPTCDLPSHLNAGSVTTTSANLSWLASMDADSIRLVVSLSEPDSALYIKPADIVVDTFVTNFSFELKNLERNTMYYWFVNSYCSGETSGWSAASFRTRNISDVPYVQNFNKTYLANSPTHMEYMTSGTSIMESDGVTMDIMPYVNRNTAESDWRKYAYDSTSCFVFSGSKTSVTTAIPAGEYAYGATPEMNVEDVRDLSVTFWGYAERYAGEDYPEYAGAIIVGIMTNPDDYATFVPVDTCYLSDSYMHHRFTVDLKNYQGYQIGDTTIYGKYIAFASDFQNKKNLFYLDNLKVEYAKTASIPQGLSFSNVNHNSLNVNVSDLGASTAWNLVVASDLVYDGSKPQKVLVEKEGITATSISIEADTLEGKVIYLYAQGLSSSDSSIFALPVGIKIPRMQDTLPYEITFNAKEEAKGTYSSREIVPFNGITTTRNIFPDVTVDINTPPNRWPWYSSSAPAMVMSYVGEYIAMPAVPNVKDVFVNFGISPYYSSASHVDDARIALGVMTDPYDISTFDSIAVFDGTGTMSPRVQNCAYALSGYTGEGKYIAFKYVLPKSGNDENGVNIYNVSFYSQSARPRPYDIELTAGSDSAEVAWKGNAEVEHQVVVTKMKAVAVSTDSYGTYSLQYQADTTVIDTVLIGLGAKLGLEPLSVYQISISAIYGTDTLPGIINYAFTTDCREKEPIPYFDDMESYAANSQFKQYPACWIGSPWKSYTPSGSYSHTQYYPNISSSSLDGYTHSGKNILVMGASTISTTDQWLALPELDAEINTLQLSMWLKPANAGYNDTIEIGLIPVDATDLSVFEHVAYVKVQGLAAMKEYIVRLDEYVGSSAGKRLCMVKRSTANHYYYIDDVKVEPLSLCPKVMDVEVENIGTMGATAKWTSAVSTKWEFLMTAKSMTEAGLDTLNRAAIDSTIVYLWETVDAMPYAFISEKAKVNTTYYVRVRGICDDKVGAWSDEVSFATMCESVNIDTYKETFSVKGNEECWTMGVRSGTTNAPSFNTNGYLYMFNTTASDGAYAVTPPMNTDDISKYQISFDAHGGNSAAYLKEVTVGVVTNASDLTTFEPMTTLKLNQVSLTTVATNYGFDEAYRYTVRFDQYEGDWRGNKGNRIMFLSESGDLANYVYVDNIEFKSIAAVREPLEVWAEEVGEKYAILTWDTVGTKYKVKVSSKKIDPATEEGDIMDSLVQGNGVRVDGLKMLTRYYVYVQTVGEESESLWSNMRWFNTVCPLSYNMPYENDFSGKVVRTSSPYDGVDCWNLYYGGQAIEEYLSGSAFYCRPYASANKAGTVTGDNGLYLGSTFGTASTPAKSAVAVLPVINADWNKAMIEFDWRTSVTTVAEASKRNLAYGIAEYAEPLDSVLATVQWLDTINTGENYGTWIHEMLPLNTYEGAGKHLVLCQFGGSGSGTTVAYAYLDNLRVVEAPEVFAPATIECGRTYATTAELSWKQTIGDYKQWQVVAVKAGEAIPENPEVSTFDTTACVLTGLLPSTSYEFYVRAVSGDKVSPWVSEAAKGSTLYLVEVADAFWNFDSQSTQEHYNNSTYWKEKGWLQGMIRGSFSNSNVPYLQANSINATSKLRTSWYSFSGDTCMRFYSSSTVGSYTLMPQINCNLDSMQLRFKARPGYGNESTGAYSNTYAKGTYSRSITVGYMTDPYDYNTFKEITTYKADEVTATKLADDPQGTNFWREVVIPLYGVGEGKYIVFATNYDQTNYMYIDDVIVEKETGCAVPVQTSMLNEKLKYNTAAFKWGSGKEAWDVQIITKATSGEDSIVVNTTVDTLYFEVDTLKAETAYTFRVRSNCGGEEFSDWISIPFTTPCVPQEAEDAVWNFENNLVPFYSSGTTHYDIPACWANGITGSTTQSYKPYAYANTWATTTAKAYARNDEKDGKALRFYTTASYYNAYVALPDMAFPLDSMTLHFWGRAAEFYSTSNTNTNADIKGKGRLSSVNSGYSRTLVIGVMTNVEDFETFTPLDTITYNKVWSGTINTSMADRFITDDKSGNNWWQEYAIPLAKYAGKGHIAIAALKPTATSYFYVDDMEIVKGTFCTAANNIRITNVSAHNASIAWNLPEDACDSVSIELYAADKDGLASDSIVMKIDSTIASRELSFNNLISAHTYFFRIKHLCSEDEESPWSALQSFICSYEAPLFVEDFAEERMYPANWTRGGSTTTSTSTGSSIADFIETGKVGSFTSDAASSNAAWRRNSNDADGMGEGTIYSILSTGTGSSATFCYAWLFTPAIFLDGEQAENMMLSFDLGMWNNNRKSAPKALGLNDQFVVLISEDGGASWSLENSWAWKADGTGDFDYNEVQNERRKWYVDMTKYVGKNIKIAFYAESHTYQGVNTGNYLYLDNVQLNTFSKNEYSETICRWNDYADASFEIDAYDLIVGKTTTYDEYIASTKKGYPDKLTILNLTVECDTLTPLSATICEGSDYEENGFVIHNAKASDTYKRKLSGENKCDSIVELQLTVIPIIHINIEDTICQGAYYEFKGEKYYTNTTVTETFTASTGCDSIVTLYLTVTPILEGETEEVFLCPDSVYYFSEKYPALTEAGIYKDTIKNAKGCDSLIAVEIKNVPNEKTFIRAAICPNEKYDEYPFRGLSEAGDWTSTLKTVYGCDSIVTLHLLVATATEEQTFVLNDSVSPENLPYVLNDEEILPVGTEEGVYTRTVNLNCGEATLVITVGNPQGINNTFVNSLAVMPNPAQVGEPIRILGTFDDATVEVTSATGALVYTAQNLINPITIPGMPVAGVYLIRVRENGRIYQAKLMVK